MSARTRSLHDVEFGVALELLLSDLDIPRRASVRTVVGMCSPFARFKRLADLPPLNSAARVQEALTHAAHLFFPVPQGSVTVGGVCQDADGLWCATAFQVSALERLRAGCQRSGLILDRVVATPVAIARQQGSGSVLFRFDASEIAIEVRDGQPGRVTVPTEVRTDVPRLEPPADAEAAALLARSEPLSKPVVGSRHRRLARRAADIVTVISATGALLLAVQATPLWTSTMALERTLALVVDSTARAEDVRNALRRESSAVAPFELFVRGRVPTTVVLTNLLDALGGDAEVTELVIDSTGAATFQVRSATLPRTIEKLSQSPDFESVRLVGRVSQRTNEDGRFAVATIRLVGRR
ncbi:MAG: hypothetical protein ACF8NJ_10550 [Phycisphaerales bacterium JB038]